MENELAGKTTSALNRPKSSSDSKSKSSNRKSHGVLDDDGQFSMGSDEENVMTYFKKIKIVPVSISYEYDPTDALKMPQL